MVNGQDCTQIAASVRYGLSLQKPKDKSSYLNLLVEMRVSDGFAERSDDGQIVAHVEFKGVTVHNHTAMAIMGIDKATFATADEYLSIDPDSPSIFESLTDFKVSRANITATIVWWSGGNGGGCPRQHVYQSGYVLQQRHHFR